jgi:hypothetical protein
MQPSQFIQTQVKMFIARAAAHSSLNTARQAVVEELEVQQPGFRARGACAEDEPTYRSCGGVDATSSPSSKRSRVASSELELAMRALKVQPATEEECAVLYQTVETLVTSIGAVRATLTNDELTKLGELTETVDDTTGWIGNAVGSVALANLKRMDEVMSQPAAYNAGGDCVICLESVPSATTSTTTPCGHAMHSECLAHWLAVAPAPRCPICVGPLERPAATVAQPVETIPPFINLVATPDGGTVRYASISAEEEEEEYPPFAYRSSGCWE